MEQYELHPTIDNTELLENREDLEKQISELRIEIGKNKAFIEDPDTEAHERITVSGNIAEQEQKLVKLIGELEKLNIEYNEELGKKVEEIEQSFNKAA